MRDTRLIVVTIKVVVLDFSFFFPPFNVPSSARAADGSSFLAIIFHCGSLFFAVLTHKLPDFFVFSSRSTFRINPEDICETFFIFALS